MGDVRRVYVEKRPEIDVKAGKLLTEIRSFLGISGASSLRILNRYDIEGVSEETYKKAVVRLLSEPPVDYVYEESLELGGAMSFSVEYLPGQYDQRADSAAQCIQLLDGDSKPTVKSALTYVIDGDISDEQFAAIKRYCINPVDSRETGLEKPETLLEDFSDPEDVEELCGFAGCADEDFKKLYRSLGLAMTFEDFLHTREYFRREGRDPTITEIRVLDTYWSDHCRHTTFCTKLCDISFEDGDYSDAIRRTYDDYRRSFDEIYAGREDKYISLMDLALMPMRRLKMEGFLLDQEETDEINACSIVLPVKIDGKERKWLLSFKNETHNHPTEIEPYGGAATCLGGAIRDPLSARSYVYQAMRVSGAADPTAPVESTISGKLPQKKICVTSAEGFSSYGNQIGLATGYVKEIYHPGYAAKRMEVGVVLGAAPMDAVKRDAPVPGDVIVLLGGRTGRDGIGGATGSSKAHTASSIDLCGAEVQKGNPPTERKIQRLFRKCEVSRLIKRCNDFGAGGVSVAIGELSDGLYIDLDRVPKKYAGLDGTELAISESQERMAVVLSPEDVKRFIEYASEENLEATPVARVSAEPRLVLSWRGKEIVNLSRAFLDTNGALSCADVRVASPSAQESHLRGIAIDEAVAAMKAGDVKGAWIAVLSDLNVCSQKGLVERFDSSIGAASIYMPYGGMYQLTETQVMAARIPSDEGVCDTVSVTSCGFDPYLSSWSPYHGAAYAVLESVAKIVSSGADYKKIHLTFQEYFCKMRGDPSRFGLPFAALLGAYHAQMGFKLASIGGKDSMSGSFEDLDVPPTLISFAVAVAKDGDLITPEIKRAGNVLLRFTACRDADDMPDYECNRTVYDIVTELIGEGRIYSAYAADGKGIAPAISKMAFGNCLGVDISGDILPEELFVPAYGDIIAEMTPHGAREARCRMDKAGLSGCVKMLGTVTDDAHFKIGDTQIAVREALESWMGTLCEIYPPVSGGADADKGVCGVDGDNKCGSASSGSADDLRLPLSIYEGGAPHVRKGCRIKPLVFIPVFPGTNCEYDSAKAFERVGARVETCVFKNRTPDDIQDSVDEFEKSIERAQIVMFPGGFSAGDEPEGSAKFIATAFRNARLCDALLKLLYERDGLCLGICNGFQSLIKLGLLPYGTIRDGEANSPTLTYNTLGRHISRMVYTKVVSNLSPWLALSRLGEVYTNPVSHGEGRFIADDEWLERLFENGQVATQYADQSGEPTMDSAWNVNGSVMAIEGISSPDGRVLGKMAHSERIGSGTAINICGKQDLRIFESGVNYYS